MHKYNMDLSTGAECPLVCARCNAVPELPDVIPCHVIPNVHIVTLIPHHIVILNPHHIVTFNPPSYCDSQPPSYCVSQPPIISWFQPLIISWFSTPIISYSQPLIISWFSSPIISWLSSPIISWLSTPIILWLSSPINSHHIVTLIPHQWSSYRDSTPIILWFSSPINGYHIVTLNPHHIVTLNPHHIVTLIPIILWLSTPHHIVTLNPHHIVSFTLVLPELHGRWLPNIKVNKHLATNHKSWFDWSPLGSIYILGNLWQQSSWERIFHQPHPLSSPHALWDGAFQQDTHNNNNTQLVTRLMSMKTY